VHAALERLCDHKCVYCEAPAPASAAWDVEHYRPKGRVHERREHPGYYWLAYAWDNLLLACEFCNRRRRDRPTWEEPGAGPASGKADHFPLMDETSRAMDPDDDLALERRLLLDPTRDEPEDHVTFDLTGRAVALGDSAMGAASIALYHLNRRRLVTQRAAQVALAVRIVDALVSSGRCSLAVAIEVVTAELGGSDVAWAGTARALRRDPAAFGLG
jgi:hypothetical protein